MFNLQTTLIAAGASAVIAGVGAWWVTADYKEAKYTGVIAKMRQDAAEALAGAQAMAAQIERENTKLAQEIEVNNAKYKQELAKLSRDNRRLVAERGLYDRGTAQSDCPVSGGANTPSQPARPSTGTRLSAELTEFLLRQSERADEAASYAKTCYEWVQQLEKQR